MSNKTHKKTFKKIPFLTFIIFTILGFILAFPQTVLAVTYLPDGQEGAGGPGNGEIGVPVDALVDRAFNGALKESTVNTANVWLKRNDPNQQGGTPTGDNLCVNVYLQGTDRIVCDHMADDTPLDANTWYTFKITTDVQDTGGNPIEAEFTSQFQTGSFEGGDAFKPPAFVLSTIPFPGGTLPTNGKIIISFSMPMRTSGEGSVLNVNNIQLFAISNGVPTGSNLFTDTSGWSFDSATYKLKIVPPALTAGNWYRVVIKGFQNFDPTTFDPQNPPCGGEGEPACVLSEDGLPIPGPDFWLDFQTTSADNTPPSVLGSFPEDNATAVDRAVFDIAVSFSEGLDVSTIKAGSVTPPQDGTVLLFKDDGNGNLDLVDYDLTTDSNEDTVISTGSVLLDPDGRSIHYSPNAILDANSKYFLVLRGGASGIKDFVGNALNGDVVITFTTGNLVNGQTTDNTAPTILFANADNFGIFVTFSEPMKFDPVANVSKSSSDGANYVNNLSNWKLETSPDGTDWMTISLSGREVKYEPYTKTLITRDLLLPPNQQFRIKLATGAQIHDLSGNSLPADVSAQGTIKMAAETGGQLGPGGLAGGPDFFEMGINPIDVMPKSALAGATTRYRVEFTVEQGIPSGGKITLTFPSGFSFAPSCNTIPTDTFENSDLNGPAPGIVTVTASCDEVARMISLTVNISGANTIYAGDRLRFELQGIINSTVPKDFTTDGYTVDIKTYDNLNTLLESKTSMPFFITTPGNNTIEGKVFVDSILNGILDEGESGVDGSAYPIKVCLGGPTGYECQTIDSNGNYSFTQLPDSFYHLDIPPISTGNYTGGPFFRDVNVSGGQTITENFAVGEVPTDQIIDVLVTGGPANTKVDVFGFQGGMPAPGEPPAMGSFVVRELTLDNNGQGNVSLPAGPGKWQVGVGPWMPKDPGAPPSPPDFTFMPPKPVEVKVDGGVQDLCPAQAAYEVCFSLQITNRRIIGKVVDGSGNAIPHAFVMARPFTVDPTEPAAAGMDEADSNGVFEIKVINGTYIVEASMPGMPLSTSFECTVKDNSDNTDNNTYADVYCEGTLIKNDVSGFNSSSLTDTPDENDLIIKIKKGDTSISGRVLDEEGNPIPFAHVSAMEVASCVTGQDIPVGPWTDAPTDSSGTYTLYVTGGSSQNPKYWQVRAFASGFGDLPPICTSVVQGQNLTGKNFQVSSDEFGTVTGQVLQGGSGVSGAFVNIYGENGANSTVTGLNGNYTLKVRAGSGYTIEGFIPGRGPTSVITGVTVTAGSTLSNQNLLMEQPGTLIVYLCEIDTDTPGATSTCIDKAVGSAFVDARDAQGRGNSSSSNPTMGVYELYLPAGTYTVKASEPAAGFLGEKTNVSISGGQTTYINIEPPPLYTVTGSVTSTESACIEGATVVLSNITTGQLIMAEVSANGTFSVSNVPVGSYNVVAMKPGCVDSEDPGFLHVTGTGGDTYTVDTRTLVKADAVISGRVTLSGENIAFPGVVFASSSSGKKVVAEVDTTTQDVIGDKGVSVTPRDASLATSSSSTTSSSSGAGCG